MCWGESSFRKVLLFMSFFLPVICDQRNLLSAQLLPLSTSFPNLFPCHAFSSHSSSRGFQCRPINCLLSLYSCGPSNNITTELCSLLYSHLLLDVHEMGYPFFHCFLHLFLPGFIIPLFSGKMILMYILALLLCDVQWLLQEVPEKTPTPVTVDSHLSTHSNWYGWENLSLFLIRNVQHIILFKCLPLIIRYHIIQ